MMVRIWGAVLILVGCSGFGMMICISYKREEELLQQLIHAVNFMQCELQYHLTPLPDLCVQASTVCSGKISEFLGYLSDDLKQKQSPDVASCLMIAKSRIGRLPTRLELALDLLAMSLGKFDVDGQLQGLDAVKNHCTDALNTMGNNRDIRLRSYQTLGICGGAALVILMV